MTGNLPTHIGCFKEFVRLIAVPGSEHQKAKWRPQSRVYGLNSTDPSTTYSYIGNFEKLSSHVVEIFFRVVVTTSTSTTWT